MINNINLFDCTLRESGYQTGWFFDTKFVHDIYSFTLGKGIDYLELGFFHNQEADPNRGIYRYCSQKNEELNKVFGSIKGRTKLSSMRDIQRPLSELVPKNNSVIDAIRIINRSHENDFRILEKEINYIRDNGYEAFVNFTSAGYNTIEQNIEFAKFAKKIGLDSLYFADRRVKQLNFKNWLLTEQTNNYLVFIFKNCFIMKSLKKQLLSNSSSFLTSFKISLL